MLLVELLAELLVLLLAEIALLALVMLAMLSLLLLELESLLLSNSRFSLPLRIRLWSGKASISSKFYVGNPTKKNPLILRTILHRKCVVI
jgi:hypothetical protein